MVVRRHRRAGVVEHAGCQRLDRRVRRRGGRLDAERAGHPKVHDEHAAIVEPREQVLGAAVQRVHATPGEPGRERVREREAQVGATLLHRDDPRAGHDGVEAAPDGLDFG